MTKKIPDLHYEVVRVPTRFTNYGYATVFYRHDREGNAYIDNIDTTYGRAWREVRSSACRFGREVVARKVPRGYLNTYVTADAYGPVKAAMPYIVDAAGRIRGAK